MADPPEKRVLYIALIAFAAIVPLAVNRDFGGIFSLASVLCVAAFIRSDRRRTRARPGFPVIFKGRNTGRSPTHEHEEAHL